MNRTSICSLVGITAFGVTYDSGFFGPPDGHDHSAVISMPVSTGSVAAVTYIINNMTGEDVAMQAPYDAIAKIISKS